MERVNVAIIGAGTRGQAYADYAAEHPEEMNIIAVAEPNPERRRQFQERHGVDDTYAFSDAEALLAQERLADAVVICTQDRDHYAQTMLALARGYHVLLEKPMSPSPEECIALGERSRDAGVVLSICHVLRYTVFFTKIKELLVSGKIGRLMTVQLNEYVGYWHQAHSFVRGNWRNSVESSPMILAKACHDMDIIQWLIDAECRYVSSFGSLSHFRSENAPEGAPARCLDGCPVMDSCAYYAPKQYLTEHIGWPTSMISTDLSYEGRVKALQEGPYGRCVYHCDNDVVDHQVVNFEFANEVAAVFTMSAFSRDGGRFMQITGTEGEIRAAMDKNELILKRFDTGEEQLISLRNPVGNHGGGDTNLMRDFIRLVRSGGCEKGLTSAENSIQSHLLAFAAEASRLEKRTIDMRRFVEEKKLSSEQAIRLST
ncbi:oxidoreductase [Paenibacillus baekrokdamisoli]|uniref:Oxidoreductase n=1 Tax=Paenibacillus baekrokdamisoli TaxID=1712516 RepID=A0A3G9JLI2_9BACL|nr:Gfo/Idh/MocA family oxidoreductase [Paenibacillus baekrokdamisoli]MBB3069388.1 putative dehydrogenase [Paenibacillus baekrokdamisoli]BBH25038.1 oxidoreductase [Paenibacillus baekrokdamisoli]BBH25056.1 oxidoreductase [Paenibacillus baekrokdamisoli]